MAEAYVFDVDGTLTPNRNVIDDSFRDFLIDFSYDKPVYFVTGADHERLIKQLGEEVLEGANAVYCCNASIKLKNGREVFCRSWRPNVFLLEFLNVLTTSTKWTETYGTQIERRKNMVNFSIVGRDCPQDARERYHEWDKEEKERETICRLINDCYPDVIATIGGQISVDICSKEQTKATILEDTKEFGDKYINFFGDMVVEGGNDWDLAQRILTDKIGSVHKVDNWKDTYKILKLKGA